jgi:phosphopantetheinyl transferase
VEHLYAQGYRQFVEVGPSSSLTGFVRDTLRDQPHVAVALDSRRQSGLRHLLMSLAQLWVAGVDLSWPGSAAAPQHEQPKARREAKAAYQIALSLPRLTINNVPEPPSPIDVEPPALPTEQAVATATPSPPEIAPATTVAPPIVPASTSRLNDVMTQQFNLMQQFLRTQETVHEQLLGLQSTAPANADANPVPAIDPRVLHPLLGSINHRSETELIATKRLDLNNDRFLRHHTLGPCPSRIDPERLALPVVPFTFSMEIIAEAARALIGTDYHVIGMRDLRGTQWLALDEGVLELQIRARVVADPMPDRAGVHVAIYATGDIAAKKSIPLFEGKVIVSTRYRPVAFETLATPSVMNPTGLAPETLYTTGMFHGPMLQGVTAIHGWWDGGIEAELTVLPTTQFFAPHSDAALSIDAGLLDAAGQLVGYWLTEKFGSDFNCFPFLVRAFDVSGPWPSVGQRIVCRGRIGFSSKSQLEAAFVLLDESGEPFAQLLGWTDRYFRIPERFYRARLDPWNASLATPIAISGLDIGIVRVEPFADDFLDEGGAIWKRVLAHLLLAKTELEQFYKLADGSGRRTEWLLGRIAAKELVRRWAIEYRQVHLAPADIAIENDANGKPHAVLPSIAGEIPDISISHHNGAAVAALAGPGQSVGVDLQHFPDSGTTNLVALHFAPQEKEILEHCSDDERRQTAIIMWSAKEAAAKSAGQGLFSALQEWIVQSLDKESGLVLVRKDNGNGTDNVTVRSAISATDVVSGCVSNTGTPKSARHAAL